MSNEMKKKKDVSHLNTRSGIRAGGETNGMDGCPPGYERNFLGGYCERPVDHGEHLQGFHLQPDGTYKFVLPE